MEELEKSSEDNEGGLLGLPETEMELDVRYDWFFYPKRDVGQFSEPDWI